MDTRAADRVVIEKVLAEYAAIPYAHGKIETQIIFDRARDHYLLMIVGQEGHGAKRRIHGCLIHIDLIGDQIIIQRDGTEHGIAPELVREGVAPERIVLAFHHLGARPYSSFLAA